MTGLVAFGLGVALGFVLTVGASLAMQAPRQTVRGRPGPLVGGVGSPRLA